MPSKVVTEWHSSYSADQVATEMRVGCRTQSDSEANHESPSHRPPNFQILPHPVPFIQIKILQNTSVIFQVFAIL